MTGEWAPPDSLLADARDLAAGYREDGWRVTSLEPSTVTTLEGDAGVGFAVFVPKSALEALESPFEAGAVDVDGAEVYCRDVGGVVFAIAVELDEETGTAVVIPIAYRPQDAERTLERALEVGELFVHVRAVERDDRWVGFSHDDPTLFVPEGFERGG